MSELTESCPNQHVLIDRKLTSNVRIDINLSKGTKIYQLGRVDSGMFLSIRTLFPCSDDGNLSYVIGKINNSMILKGVRIVPLTDVGGLSRTHVMVVKWIN